MKFLKHTSKSAPLALTLALTVVQAAAQLAPTMPVAKLSSLSFLGSGCPAGSFGAAVDANGQFLNVQFAQFTIPTSAPVASQTKNCTLKLNLQAPMGFEVAIDKTIYVINAAQKGVTNASVDANATFNGLTTITQNRAITTVGTTSMISSTGSGWSGCATPAPLEDRIVLKITPVVAKPNADIRLAAANYSLKYRACQLPPASGFTFVLSGSTASGWTASGTCNEGHKIKVTARHSSYLPSPSRQTPPLTATEFEDYCGGTKVIPITPKKLPYAWAGPLPPTNVYGNVVFSNSPPLPMPPNTFVAGMWTFEASQVEATPANPSWPRTVLKPPPVLVN